MWNRIESGTPSPQNAVNYYLDDHLGTTQMELSGSGWPLWQGQFTPFGQELDNSSTSMHYKFTGKERDTETGLDNFGARYYASNMGRFMSPDWANHPQAVPYASLSNPQSLNLYAYVNNNPLSQVDADGHFPNSPVSEPMIFNSVGGDGCAFQDANCHFFLGRADFGGNPDLQTAADERAYEATVAQAQRETAQQQSASKPSAPVQGALSAPSLLAHYVGGSGSDYQLTDKSFSEFIYEMNKQGKLPAGGDPVPGVDGLSQATVNTYGTKYENAVGLGVLYFQGGKPVGYSDWWNFDPKPAGARSKTGEILVDTAAHLPGKPFLVLYGTTPPPNTIPRN